MKNNTITKAMHYFWNAEDYFTEVNQLIENALERDPSLVQHSIEEMEERFPWAVIQLHNNKIIWHASIYPTHMKPLDTILFENKPIQIGEMGSVVIHPEHQWRWFGSLLTQQTLEQSWSHYAGIISATISPLFKKIAERMWFTSWLPFPKDYYQEWLQHLSPKLPGKEHEFMEKASFLVLAPEHIKKEISLLLHNQ